MNELQQEYREQMNTIVNSKSSVKVKKLLMENLINSIRFV